MSSEIVESYNNAKVQLTKLMNNLTKSDREKLLCHAFEQWTSFGMKQESAAHSDNDDYENDEHLVDDPVKMLTSISKELRQKLPLDVTTVTDNSESVNLDAFLYDEDDIDGLKTHYCRDCQSKNIEPIKFVSQSLSEEDLYLVFNTYLPTLDGKIVLDVSSKIGASLYGAFAYTDAEKIIGLETNNEFCELQNQIITKYKMEKRVEVLSKKLEEALEHVRTADVIFLINISEDYESKEDQVRIWNLLKENIKKDAYIILCDNLVACFKELEIDINVNDWVKRVDEDADEADLENESTNDESKDESHDDDDCYPIFCYQVL